MSEPQSTTYGIRHHLCPTYTAPLTIGEHLCPSCKLEFKNEQKARNLSILLPGGESSKRMNSNFVLTITVFCLLDVCWMMME